MATKSKRGRAATHEVLDTVCPHDSGIDVSDDLVELLELMDALRSFDEVEEGVDCSSVATFIFNKGSGVDCAKALKVLAPIAMTVAERMRVKE